MAKQSQAIIGEEDIANCPQGLASTHNSAI